MSRTNPYKKKRRCAKRTLLMYGEGLGEEIFLKHLRSFYAQNSGVSVTIRNGKGGNPESIVTSAVNELGDYDKRVVVLDNDLGKEEMDLARDKARMNGIVLLENNPCLEATLLSILRSGQNFSTQKSAWCKSEFESSYLDKKKRSEQEEYKKVFSKKILDKQKDIVLGLKVLIDLMQGK